MVLFLTLLARLEPMSALTQYYSIPAIGIHDSSATDILACLSHPEVIDIFCGDSGSNPRGVPTYHAFPKMRWKHGRRDPLWLASMQEKLAEEDKAERNYSIANLLDAYFVSS